MRAMSDSEFDRVWAAIADDVIRNLAEAGIVRRAWRRWTLSWGSVTLTWRRRIV